MSTTHRTTRTLLGALYVRANREGITLWGTGVPVAILSLQASDLFLRLCGAA